MTEALYRGQSALGFGLWRLNEYGHWVFSMPVEGATWRRVEAPDLARLVELGDRESADAELIADTLSAARALAAADLHPGDAVHDAANLQEMLAFVIEQYDQCLVAGVTS